MKKLVKLEEVEGVGLIALMGEKVLLLCANYFYAGTLTGVNDTQVELENAAIVYETGEWTAKSWKDVQPIGTTLYVKIAAIESYCKGK